MKNELKIMDGIAKIKRCKSSSIWQFSMWIKKEKKYYRATTGTRNTEQAIDIARKETAELIYRSETKKEKIFGITVSEGIAEFLDWKRRQIHTEQIVPQRLQTIISHLAHFEKYLDGQFKVNEIPKTILRNNIVDGVEKNYIEYRTIAEVEVLPETSKVRIGRTFCVDAEQLLKWKEVCKHTTGYIFSIDGNYEYKRQNINEAFKQILEMSTIDKKRQSDLV